MEPELILLKLKDIKSKYKDEGFDLLALFGSYATNSYTKNSDIDILYDVNEKFLATYKGFKSVSKVLEIQKELSNIFHTNVDLTSPSGLNQSTKKEILSKAIYV